MIPTLLVTLVVLHQRNIALWCKGGNRMLVDHLLTAFAVNHNRKIIEGLDLSSDLEPVRQIYGDRHTVFAQLVQKVILNIDGFVHKSTPLRFATMNVYSFSNLQLFRYYTTNCLLVSRKIFSQRNINPYQILHVAEP